MDRKMRGSCLQNHLERTYQALSGSLWVELVVRFSNKGRAFEVSTGPFPPNIPGVKFETREGRSAMRTFASDPKLAYEWLGRNARRID